MAANSLNDILEEGPRLDLHLPPLVEGSLGVSEAAS
jgi:hypothetical protein